MKEPPYIQVQPTTRRQTETKASMEEVLDAFSSLRACVLDLMDAAKLDPTKTREMARELGVNRGLAWRLSRMVRAEDSAGVAHDVPGRQSMSRFAEICTEKGADRRLADRLVEAASAYEKTVASCTGGRKTLGMLLANRGEDSTQQDRERARRTLFEGACSVWGVQAQVRFVTVFLFPSPENPAVLDAAHVTGYVGFRRLSERPWPLSYEAVHDASGRAQPLVKIPLDPSGSKEGQLQLVREFCDPRSPEIEVQVQGDYKCFNLAAGPVGNAGLTTCVFGSYLRSLYETAPAQPDTAGFMVLLQTPVERVMFDYFVHRDIPTDGRTITHLLDRLTFPHQNRESDFDRQSMAITEEPRPLPAGTNGALTANIPWYPRLLDFVSRRVGMPVEDFNGSRFEMAYPPISTTLSRRVLLLGRGDRP